MAPDRGDESRLTAFETATHRSMVAVSLAVIPIYVAQALASDASTWVTRPLDVTRYTIHAAMTLDVGFRTYLAPRRGAFLAHHKLDILAIFVPPVRALREVVALRFVLVRPGLIRFAGFAVATIVGCALVVYSAEHDHEGASIDSLTDALWWAAVTATTVGYGDEVPVTGQGRLMALVLMLLGIVLFSVLTAHIAAYFVGGRERDAKASELTDRLERMEGALISIEARLEQVSPTGNTLGPAAGGPPDEPT